MRYLVFALLTFVTLTSLLAQGDRQGARRIGNGGSKSKSPCGTDEQVSKRVGDCLKPLFEIIEGKIERVPVVASDFDDICSKFTECEKCLRVITKDCVTGLQKTAVGAFITSIVRFRKEACKSDTSRMKYKEPIKCIKNKGDDTTKVFRNLTGISQAIRDLRIEPEDKMIKICCVLKEMDVSLEKRFDDECPKQTKLIMDIVHSVTDDARSVLCVNPKCQGSLNGVDTGKYKPPQTVIEPIMQILLMISTE